MLPTMFGMGGTEIIVILIVALLFLGPDKLPDAAKKISKGIRDIKRQTRVLQRTIEDDEHIGGAIRDIRSALRGEDEPIRPPKPATPALPEPSSAHAALAAAVHAHDGVPDEHNLEGSADPPPRSPPMRPSPRWGSPIPRTCRRSCRRPPRPSRSSPWPS
jgi:sec-independent protein translocase protein TatB